jgi:hypothetical protein
MNYKVFNVLNHQKIYFGSFLYKVHFKKGAYYNRWKLINYYIIHVEIKLGKFFQKIHFYPIF